VKDANDMRSRAFVTGMLVTLPIATLMLMACGRAQSVPQGRAAPPAGTGVAVPSEPGAPAGLPDLPVNRPSSSGPLTVKFVVEHRSALARKRVTVSGVVVWALTGDEACAAGQGMCAQPRIKIADTAAPSRNLAYDLVVLLPAETDARFAIGQRVEISGRVAGGPEGVLIRQD
jgi:hypothetical protein